MSAVMIPQGQRGGSLVQSERRGSPRESVSVLFKWKWFILGAFLAVFVPVAALSMVKPTMFKAGVKVIVKQERAYLAITPGEDERIISGAVGRQTINSEIQIITSREVIEQAVRDLNIKPAELKPAAPAHVSAIERAVTAVNRAMSAVRRTLSAIVKAVMPATPATAKTEVDEVVSYIDEALTVAPIPESNLIQISLKDENPEFAVKVVNKIAEVYRERHAAINRPEGAFNFFKKQAVVYEETLREAEERLKGYESRFRIVDLDKEIADTLARIGRIEQDLRAVEVESGEVVMRAAFLREEIRRQPERIETDRDTVINRAAEQLQQRLIQLELDKKALLQLYTEKDRRVIGKQEEIDTVRARLQSESAYVLGKESTALNPIRRSLEQDFLIGQARIESLVEKRRTLTQQLTGAREALTRLAERSSEYRGLKQAVQTNRQSYDLYQKKSEEARISEAMDREKLINVAIVERAALPLDPMGGRGREILLLAGIAGLALGVGVAYGVEFFNTSVRNERDVEEHLGLPVLATIEHFRE